MKVFRKPETKTETNERKQKMEIKTIIVETSLQLIACSFCVMVLGCGSGEDGYQMSPSQIESLQFSRLKFDVPAGEAFIMDGCPMVDYHGNRVKVNATTKRIVMTGLRSTGILSKVPFTENIPYDSIMAYRKTGLNSIYIVEANRRAHLLSFDMEIDVSLSGVELSLPYFLRHVTKHVAFSTLSGYHEKWLFNFTRPNITFTELSTMPIGFRVRESRIPFGGYVGCIHNLLDRELTVNVSLDGKEYTAQIDAGDEISFGSSEMGRKLGEGDLFIITTSASEHTLLRACILKDGEYVCAVKSSKGL